MEEKVIIKSELYNIKRIRNIILITGIVVYIIALLCTHSSEFQKFGKMLNMRRYYGIFDIRMVPYAIGNAFEYLGQRVGEGFFTVFAVFGAPFILIGLWFYAAMSEIELTITDKRVFGKASYRRRVDLPLDSVSAVGTTLLNGISVSTSSGVIKFAMIKNRDELHSAVSKLLIDRQSKPVEATVIKQEVPQNNLEDLKKLKELMDSGIISQEEFDAKKKQLLGL